MFNFFKKKNDKEENKKNIEEENIDQEKIEEEKDQKVLIEEKQKNEDPQEELSSNDTEIEDEKIGFFNKIFDGLTKTRDQFSNKLKNLFTSNVKIDDDLYEELEEILISSDIGMECTIDIVDTLREEIKDRKIKETKNIYPVLKEIMVNKLDKNNLENKLNITNDKLSIILVIGVNGVGKTTTIGKLAYNLKNDGKKVTLAAADTFRAAAIEQLGEWADVSGVEMVAHKEGSDPSAVIFDGIQAAKANKSDVLICDTAGRLHNKKNLMNELEKINRTIDTHAPDANRENLLVLDATTGQNAISQLREFKNVTDITGLILTKLDGTAKGGVIFPLQVELDVPVKYIGVGEAVENLQKFDAEAFVGAMFE
ncbi:MAG: signal recognition particle-docking protein FtsY [Anaerococcus sp.]